jgi:stage II sporulation protein AB (anti-sigma F factor)
MQSELFERIRAAQAESRRLMARARGLSHHAVVLTLNADAEAPARARNAVADLAARAGASDGLVQGIKTAVSEAVTNAVVHAYANLAPGPVYVEAYALAGVFTVLVADDGRGPRTPSPNPGLGLGWKVIAQLADRHTVTRRGPGGTMIYMRFRLSNSGLVRGPVTRI